MIDFKWLSLCNSVHWTQCILNHQKILKIDCFMIRNVIFMIFKTRQHKRVPWKSKNAENPQNLNKIAPNRSQSVFKLHWHMIYQNLCWNVLSATTESFCWVRCSNFCTEGLKWKNMLKNVNIFDKYDFMPIKFLYDEI